MAGPGHQEAKARRQAIRAWDKILTAVETESRRARLAGADRDAQHRQGQLRKQQEPKQVRARQQQRQEEEHARRRLASVAEARHRGRRLGSSLGRRREDSRQERCKEAAQAQGQV